METNWYKPLIPFSAHLFQLLGVETCVCLKAGWKYAFGEAETQLLYKSCILDEGINAQDSLWTSGGP